VPWYSKEDRFKGVVLWLVVVVVVVVVVLVTGELFDNSKRISAPNIAPVRINTKQHEKGL